ncbi:hypothetical protein B9T26_01195 [Acinetobacter sp. ANC 4169]|jgi:asparagine synthetase B (glutamine-hydrolysing)|uniref:asparagine synthase-related protein n=1 Tax=Acinetobacter sp. ANC 4169 TaxID=1977879 RepID=UPI000A354BDB|nr:asparagine synthase-related protein [Acinetobacter sp. ANC 4169]OTG77226.1 hypothetical protein B9T26_01195 [Acinetobacter sp. ANC 4169]
MLQGFFGEAGIAGNSIKHQPKFSVLAPTQQKITMQMPQGIVSVVIASDISPKNDIKAFGIGYLSNREVIVRTLAALQYTYSETATDFDLLHQLYFLIGRDAFRLAEGHFCCVLIYDTEVVLATGKTPGPKLYYYQGEHGQLLFASEIGAFPSEYLALVPHDSNFEQHAHCDPTFTPFVHVRSVCPGELVLQTLNPLSAPQRISYYSPLRTIQYSAGDEHTASEHLRTILQDAVNAIPGKHAICLVSGGLDSSIIGYLAKQHFESVRYLSIGTAQRNEFEPARLFVESIQGNYQQIEFSEQDFLVNLAEVIALVEHSYSTYLEYLVPVHIAHKHLPQDADVILSGYGSDILFAGFAKPHNSTHDIASLIRTEYQSTYWANEASQTLGFAHGLHVAYPYFDSRVVDLAFSFSPHLCHIKKIEKFILRQAFSNDIDERVVWRKKVGVHEGTGCEDFFSAYLTSSSEQINSLELRQRKDVFCHRILEEIMILGITPQNINFNKIRSSIL